MVKKLIFLGLIISVFAVSLFAVDMLEKNILGINYDYFSARESAIGGISIIGVSSPFAVLTNPALLINSDKNYTIEFSYNLNGLDEARAFPAYDNFESFMSYNNYGNNTNYNMNYNFGAKINKFKNYYGLGIGIGMYPFIDANYKYTEEHYNSMNNKDASAQIKSEGNGIIYAVGFGMKPVKYFSFGFNYGFISGERKIDNFIKYYSTLAANPMFNDIEIKDNMNYTGHYFSLGINGDINQRFGMSLVYIPAYTLTNSKDDKIQVVNPYEVTIPQELKLGFEYKPRNKEVLSVYTQLEFKNWEDYEYVTQNDTVSNMVKKEKISGKDMKMKKAFNYRLGVEHLFLDSVPIRLGFVSTQSPFDTGIRKNGFTFGTGFEVVKNFTIDTAIIFEKGKFNEKDEIPNSFFGERDRTGIKAIDRITQTEYSFMVTLKYSF